MKRNLLKSSEFIFCLQFLFWALFLFALGAKLPWPIKVAVFFYFCMLMQGVFSLMHECFHGQAHPQRWFNYFLGVFSSTLFGTSYTLFQVNHQGHHVRNRTRPEVVDLIYDDESPAKKITAYYFAILGGIWLMGLVGSILVTILPYSFAKHLATTRKNNTYAAAFLDMGPQAWKKIRYETIALMMFWLVVLNLPFISWKACAVAYMGFAFSWSSLQWVYHVRTPLDPVEGAYNLRLPKHLRLIFLNFNCNLTHHRQPTLSWHELYAHSDQEETQPLWYRWLGIFLPPQPFPNDLKCLNKVYF